MSSFISSNASNPEGKTFLDEFAQALNISIKDSWQAISKLSNLRQQLNDVFRDTFKQTLAFYSLNNLTSGLKDDLSNKVYKLQQKEQDRGRP